MSPDPNLQSLYQELMRFGPYEIAHLGPPLARGPLPSFVYFALSAEDSLLTSPYNQPVHHFLRHGWRVFTATLPEHEEKKDPHTAMNRWLHRYAKGEDLAKEFAKQFVHSFSPFIKDWVGEHYLAIGGLSRGGYIAAHVAAIEPRFQALAAYAPVTSLGTLQEWQGRSLPDFSLISLCPSLANRAICLYIGNRDLRVGTDACIDFFAHLVTQAAEQAIRSPPIELHILPSIGHKGHGTSSETFERGVLWVLQQSATQPGEKSA